MPKDTIIYEFNKESINFQQSIILEQHYTIKTKAKAKQREGFQICL
jgi:hypothetical protein